MKPLNKNSSAFLTETLECTFSQQELQSGEMYDIHRIKNEKIVHRQDFNAYYYLKFPKLQGEQIQLIYSELQMPITKEESDILFFENKGNYYTVTKKNINTFKVTIIHEQARQRAHESLGIVEHGIISLNYNFHTYKEIFHLFSYNTVTIEEIEEAVNNKFIIKP